MAVRELESKHYTIEEILTYLDCSLCHHIKYNLRMEPPAGLISSKKNILFKESIHESILAYYTEIQNKKDPDLQYLYEKFYTTWLRKNDKMEESSILTRDVNQSGLRGQNEREKYVNNGYKMMKNFYTFNNQISHSIVTFNYNYQLNIGGSFIDGKIPLIREIKPDKKRYLQLVFFSQNQKNLSETEIKGNFAYMMHSFAFQQLFKLVPDSIIVYNIKRDEVTEIHYERNDFKRLLNILQSFFMMIDKVVPCPTTSVHTYATDYKDLCDTYNYDLNPLPKKFMK